jgi:hypothetical protein
MSASDQHLRSVFLEPFCVQEFPALLKFMEESHGQADLLGIDVETLFRRGMAMYHRAILEKNQGKVLVVAGLSEDRDTLIVQEIIEV